MSHALLGPSSSSRWINCPGSARATEDISEEYSAYAEEGTLAHEICELLLKKHAGIITPQKCTGGLKSIRKKDWYTPEMEDHCKDYVDYISSIGEGDIYVEQVVSYDNYVPGGFGTADCILISGSELHVVDFKYGKGVPVDTDGNTQLMLYGLGSLLQFEAIYDIEKVFVHIFQPRLDYTYEPVEYAPVELYNFGDSIVEAAEQADRGDHIFKAGDWCRFCKMKGSCNVRLEQEVLGVFDGVVDSPGDVKDLKPAQMSESEILHWLPHIDTITKFLKDLKSFAEKEALGGHHYEGFKIVEGRSNRCYVDDELVIETLKGAKVAEDMYLTPRKLVGITELTKKIGSTSFKELIEPLLIKPEGKPTLVPESDKRKEFHPATTVFNDGGAE